MKRRELGIILFIAAAVTAGCSGKQEGIPQIMLVRQLEGAVSGADAGAAVSGEADYILPDSALRLYSVEELSSLSSRQLYLARNEIYARHGRKFASGELREYFSKKSWYHGSVEPEEFREQRLNEIEHGNIVRIKEIEEKRAAPSVVTGRTVSQEMPGLQVFREWEKSHGGRKVNERLAQDGTGTVCSTASSRLIVHDDCYEITSCQVFADDAYDKSMFDGKKVGDTVRFGKEDAVITAAGVMDNGFRYFEIVFADPSGHALELTPEGWKAIVRLKENSAGFYSDEENDIYEPVCLLYEGSVYFYKDAEITVGMMDGEQLIPAVEYFETAKQDAPPEGVKLWFGRAGGLLQDGAVHIYGNPQFDENYYITRFVEVTRNWVG